MRTTLKTEIPITRHAVLAEMAWLVVRPELGLLCRQALKNKRKLTAETIEEILPGLSPSGVTNVISWCRSLDLCDSQGVLTIHGEEVAKTDAAPVPEQGVYDLWMAAHPLLQGRVLAIARLASTKNERFEEVVEFTGAPRVKQLFSSLMDAKERFLVRAFPTNQRHSVPECIEKKGNDDCLLTWFIDFENKLNEWKLTGNFEMPQGKERCKRTPIQHEKETAAIDLDQLADTWGRGPLSDFGQWDTEHKMLSVAWNSVEEKERRSFQKNCRLVQVEVPAFGVYHEVLLENVPIGPSSEDEAQQWAMANFEARMKERPCYITRAEAQRVFQGLTQNNPLERFQPTLPSHGDLISSDHVTQFVDADKEWRRRRSWLLSAPADLALSFADVIEPDRNRAIVRIPPGENWSMETLLNFLLGDTAPTKVLLCDRYVRGAENLARLNLLNETLRTRFPNAVLEIWTVADNKNFEKIKSITGRSPQCLDQVFGKKLPHDRYFAVHVPSGNGFAWQLSNSPLHGRVNGAEERPDSPLRWNGLTGPRLAPDELDVPIREWLLKGGYQ